MVFQFVKSLEKVKRMSLSQWQSKGEAIPTPDQLLPFFCPAPANAGAEQEQSRSGAGAGMVLDPSKWGVLFRKKVGNKPDGGQQNCQSGWGKTLSYSSPFSIDFFKKFGYCCLGQTINFKNTTIWDY